MEKELAFFKEIAVSNTGNSLLDGRHVEHLYDFIFTFWGILHYIKHFSSVRCPPYREHSYSKMNEERQGPTPQRSLC